MKRKGSLLAVLLLLLPGIVEQAQAQTITKFTTNGTENVIIDGVNPASRVVLELNSQDLVRRSRGNACGWIRISDSASYPLPNAIQISDDGGLTYGPTIDTTSLSTVNSRCQNGVIVNADGSNTPPTGNFKDSSGAVIIPGQQQNFQYSIKYVGTPATTSGNANACGFRQVRHDPSRNRDLTSFTFDGQTYNLSSIPEANPPRCQRIGDNTIRYEPQ